MKQIPLLLFIFGAASSCKCKKEWAEKQQKTTITSVQTCPNDAKCTIKVYENTGVRTETDGIGKINLIFETQPGTTSFHYTMDENDDQQYMDAGYREEIAFQLPFDFKDGTISGKSILETKAVFGVFCYCKEKAGYYTLNQGTITKSGNSILVRIPAVIEGQKTTVIRLQ